MTGSQITSISEHTDRQNHSKSYVVPTPTSTDQGRRADAEELILYRAQFEDEAMRGLTPMERFLRLDDRFPENLYGRIAYKDKNEQRRDGSAPKGKL